MPRKFSLHRGWPPVASLFIILPLLALVADARAGEDRLISFSIKDQFDRLHTHGRYHSAVVVVTWGDREGSNFIGNWESALSDSLTAEIKSFRVREIAVAHLKGVPFFIKGKIKGYFPKDPDEWVLMDWGGEFNKAYDCTKDHCNLLVFGRDGKLRDEFQPRAEVLPVVNQADDVQYEGPGQYAQRHRRFPGQARHVLCKLGRQPVRHATAGPYPRQ